VLSWDENGGILRPGSRRQGFYPAVVSLEVDRVTKRFGHVTALDRLEFAVPRGAIFGFLGANGAGKTTTMRICLGILEADEGEVRWKGTRSTELSRSTWGYLPEERGLYARLPVLDQLVYFAQLYGAPADRARSEAMRWLVRFRIPEYANRRAEELSKGNQQKVQFIAAILHEPDVLLMDEPFTGLDPVNLALLREAFLELRDQGRTVVFSTHQMELAEAMCESVAIVDHGRVVAGGTIRDLKRASGRRVVRIGLNGTGDTLNNIPFTKQSLQAMLERLGVNIRGAQIRTGNVAAVMVTANLPPFGTQGTRIDVTVSALGDSKSLQGGTLLVTPLLGADGNVYAVGQGSVAIGGFEAQGDAAKIVRGVPTVGRISNGAIIEREIEFALNRLNRLRLALRNPDFTTAKRIAAAINDFIGAATAEPLDPSTVQLHVPQRFQGNVIALLTEVEQLQIDPDLAARIVIDERSGIIVMGRDVRVSMVAVAQGNLTVTIAETPEVSQPNPLARGRTVVVPRTSVGVKEDGKKLALVRDGVSLQQVVDGLNALGIGPRDLIAILQAIKAAGAIQADIEVM